MAVGAATVLGSFSARLGIDTGEYARGILNAQGATAAFGQTFTTLITNPLLGAVGILRDVGAHFTRLGGEVLSAAEHAQLLADATGASVEVIQTLESAMERAGLNAGDAGQSLAFLARQLGDAQRAAGPAREAFASIGVQAENLRSTDEALRAVVEALGSVEGGAARAAIAADLLGREAGPKLVAAIGVGAGALQAAELAARSTGAVMRGDLVRDLASADDAIGDLASRLRGVQSQFTAGFLGALAPGVAENTESLEQWARTMQDAQEAGRELGAEVKSLVGDLNDLADAVRSGVEGFRDWLHWTNQGAQSILDVRRSLDLRPRIQRVLSTPTQDDPLRDYDVNIGR